MKRTIKITSFLLTLVLIMSVFASCGGNTAEPKDLITIRWVQGQKVLKEELVERGSYLTEWTPETPEGMEFQGWYERPYIKKFVFSKPVTKSMIIYASFKSVLGEDINGEFVWPAWYVIGAGKGSLKATDWLDHEKSARALPMKEGEDGIFRTTANLYAGDQFKITQNNSWENEINIMGVEGFTFDEGSSADGGTGKVMLDGVVAFTGYKDGNWNITVAADQDGKYEIALDPNTGKITFTLLERLESLPDDIRLIGQFNGWNETYDETSYLFTSTDGENYSFTWEVTTANVQFKVYNNSSGNYYPDGDNLVIKQPGTYKVEFELSIKGIKVYDESGNLVELGSAPIGGEGDGEDNGGNIPTIFPNANPVDKVYLVVDDTWKDGSLVGAWCWTEGGETENGDWVIPNDLGNGVYEFAVPEGKNAIIFVDFVSGLTQMKWNDGTNVNVRYEAPKYAIPDQSDVNVYYHSVNGGSWNASADAPVVENNAYDIYFIGGPYPWDTSTVTSNPRLTESEDKKTWTGTIDLPAGGELKLYNASYGFTGDDGARWIGTADSQNFKLTPGKYTFTYNVETNTATFVCDEVYENTVTHEMYIVGSMNGWASGAVEPWNLTRDENGVWTGTFELTAGTTVKLHNKLANGWFGPATGTTDANGNLVISATGTYHFTYVENEDTFTWTFEASQNPSTPDAPEGNTITVYFENNWKWSNVSCHYWIDENNPETKWPGVAMTLVGKANGNDVYAIVLPANVAGIVINGRNPEGMDDKTPDIRTGLVDGAGWSMDWNNGNKVNPFTYTPAQ